MKLPSMRYSDGISKTQQVKFGGLHRSEAASDGELRDMRNLTGDLYPVLSARLPRCLYMKLEAPGGMGARERLFWVDGTGFYYDGERKGDVSSGPKAFASLAQTIVILPDKMYYNEFTDVFGSLESRVDVAGAVFTDGIAYGEPAMANTIQAEGVTWSEHFSVGDGVTISGCQNKPENNISCVIRGMDGDRLYLDENIFTLAEDGAAVTEEAIEVARTMPDLDYICEHENRLWGCGGDQIYCSKLGDCFNWNVFDSLDSDAWSVDTGSRGRFTGCCSYRGYPTFFKEEGIYKVYGSVPSNFQVLGSATMGVAQDSGGSLAAAGETLFYLNRSGIMAYTGGIPQSIGTALGLKRFRNAAAGSDGLKYYVSMADEENNWGLYVYDTLRGMWVLEDDSQVISFASCQGRLYMLNAFGEIWVVGSADPYPDAIETETVEWMAEFADFYQDDPNKKGIGKLQLRLQPEENATVSIFIMYDSDGVWQLVRTLEGTSRKRSYYLPVVPRRCDHFRVKLEGTGGCRVYSMVRETYSGSEM